MRTWISLVPQTVQPYLRLIRLDRPIGTWLLLFPCWWSITVAPQPSRSTWSSLTLLSLLFGVGAVIMRGAGCIINDIIDCRFDAQIERTRNRPLPSNQISIRQAFIFLVALLTVGFLILIHLNRITIYFGFISLLFVFTYPVMKRITWWPQAFLGLTFNCGALLGWTAVTGDFSWTAVVLYVAGLFWTLGYDTIYAHQDKIGDELIGIKSTARLFGRSSPVWVAIFYTIAILGLILTGVLVGLHPIHLLVLALAGLQLSWQVIQWSIDDPNDCLAKFESNKWFGLLVLVSFILGRVAKNALL